VVDTLREESVVRGAICDGVKMCFLRHTRGAAYLGRTETKNGNANVRVERERVFSIRETGCHASFAQDERIVPDRVTGDWPMTASSVGCEMQFRGI